MRRALALLFLTGPLGLGCSSSVPPTLDGTDSGAPDVRVVADGGPAPEAGSGGDGGPIAHPPWGPSFCPAESGTVGLKIGNQLPRNLELPDCDGNMVSLDSICGAAASWIFLSHMWCPHCQATAAQAEAIAQKYAGKNLAIVNVVIQNASYSAPTASDCTSWRTTYGSPNVVTLYDPTGKTKGFFEQNYTALSVFVDGQRVIKSKAHTDVRAQLVGGIDDALK